ncbi:MAG: filamentous hemagglutinin N-terminal domain-containing protein, partial [Gammaproteobacteria bacterium]
MACLTVSAGAGPQGGEIVDGVGQIGRDRNNTTVINQSSDRLAIDWESFNVGVNERVVFNQPSSSSTALNRIFDQNPTMIFGAVDANGRILLINPNGVLFGESARVNIQSLVATSLDLSLEDFKAGRYDLQAVAGEHGGAIINRGLIQAAAGGSVSLVGDTVSNEGVIVADYGQVNLAAGRQATLDFDGDGMLLFAVDAPVTQNGEGADSAVVNSGHIQADGGQVLMAANAARNVFSSVVNNEGSVRAMSVENVGGVIRLTANRGTVVNSGSLDASSTTGVGGNVDVSGERVGLFDTAIVDASGRDGGGVVRIGGGLQGQDDTIANADYTYIGADATVTADATVNGDGGEVIVWSDYGTKVYGDLSARGGQQGGDGGFIETSGARGLQVVKTPDVTAQRGASGEWLIDPFDITIVAGNGNVDINNSDPFESTDESATLGVDLIQTALAGGATVTVRTGDGGAEFGDITWDAGATLDFDNTDDDTDPAILGNAATLVLDADRNITINGTITDADTATAADSLDLVLVTDDAIVFGASSVVDLGPNGELSNSGASSASFLNNGALSALAGVQLALTGAFTNTGSLATSLINLTDSGSFTNTGTVNATGNLALTSIGSITNDSTITVTGDATFTTDDAFINNDTLGVGGALTVVADGNLTNAAGASMTVTGLTDLDAGQGGAAVVTLDGALALNGGATLTTGTAADQITINSAVTIDIDGGAQNDVIALDGAVTGDVTGGTGNDIFNINAALVGNVSGGDGDDDFNVDAAVTGDLNGDGDSDDFDLAAAVSGTVDGGAGDDTFTLGTAISGAPVAGTLTGGANNDTLIGPDAVTAWLVNAANAGTVETQAFTAMETLTGGSGIDTFTIDDVVAGNVNGGTGNDIFTLTGTVVGSLNGDGGSDTLNDDAVGNQWTINAVGGGTLDATTFTGIEVANGNGGDDDFTLGAAVATQVLVTTLDGGTGTNSIIGPDVAIDWLVSAANGGSVESQTFTNIETLVGGDGVDVFDINQDLDGSVTGGAGDDTFNLVGLVAGGIAGGADSDTLNDDAVGNQWQIDAVGAGTLDGTAFTGIEIANGAGGNDVFTLDPDIAIAALLATLDGGAGQDSIVGPDAVTAWLISGANEGSVENQTFTDIETLTGGSAADTFTFAAAGQMPTINGGVGADTLQGNNADNDWAVTGVGTGTYGGTTAFAGIENLLGGTGADTFTLSTGIAAQAFVTTLDGGGGSDTLVGPNVGTTFTLDAANGGNAEAQSFDSIENLAGGTAADVFNLDFDIDGDVLGNGGDDEFFINATVAGNVDGGAGDDEFTLVGSVTGLVSGGADTDTLFDDGVGNNWLIDDEAAGLLDGTAFSEIEVADGGDGADTFTVDGGQVDQIVGGDTGDDDTVQGGDFAVDWTIVGLGEGTYDVDTAFSGIEVLMGGSNNDTFTVLAGIATQAFVSTLDGGAGDDTLVGPDVDTMFVLNAANAGDADMQSFVSIENLTGGTANDVFDLAFDLGGDVDGGAGNDQFTLVGTVGGTLSGGAGDDTLFDDDVGNMWMIDGAGTGALDGTAFAGIEVADGGLGADTFTFVGGGQIDQIEGGAGVDTIVGSAGDNVFIVDMVDSGTYDTLSAFASVENLSGGDGMDRFDLQADLSGAANGDTGDDTFAFNGGDALTIDGGGDNDALQAPDGAPQTITVEADGSVSANFTNATVSNVESFAGGDGDDIFNILGVFTGSLFGGDGDDQFTLMGGSATLIDGQGGADTLSGTDDATTWTVASANAGTAGTQNFESIE